MTDPTPTLAPLPLRAQDDPLWYRAAEALLPGGDTRDTWCEHTWECLRLARMTPAQAVAYQTGPKGRWGAARKALKQALQDGATGPTLEAARAADRDAWYAAVEAHLPAGTTPDAWAPATWETLRTRRDMGPLDAVNHQTDPARRSYRIEATGQRARTATTRRGAERALGAMLTTKGQTGRILEHGTEIIAGKATTLGWVSMAPTYATIIAATGQDHVDTGAGPALIVSSARWAPGTDVQDAIDRVAVPYQVTLTQDGRYYDHTSGWHTGPETGDPVYVERWTPKGRDFHGWIDPTTRQLIQAG